MWRGGSRACPGAHRRARPGDPVADLTDHRNQPIGPHRDDRVADVTYRVGSRVLLESSQRVAEQSSELAELLHCGRVQDLTSTDQ
jgi:hypothetical protein